MSLKDNSYLEPWQPLCSGGEEPSVQAIEGIMRNNSVKLF